MTASSATRSPRLGWIVTSYCRSPYSGRKLSGFALERGERTTQKVARTAFPGLAIERHDIGEVEALGRAITEFDLDLCARIRQQHEIAFRAERRLVDRPEDRHHDVAVGEADAVAQPRRKIGRGKTLAAHQPGEIAGADKDERFALHGPTLESGSDSPRAQITSKSIKFQGEPKP